MQNAVKETASVANSIILTNFMTTFASKTTLSLEKNMAQALLQSACII